MRIIFGIFIILHGLVHLLYFGQSLRFFELQPGMTWPDGSWFLSKFLSAQAMRMFFAVLCIIVAAGFILSGIGLLFSIGRWRTLLVTTTALSLLTFVLAWNSQLQNLDDQGGYSVLINIMILAGTFI